MKLRDTKLESRVKNSASLRFMTCKIKLVYRHFQTLYLSIFGHDGRLVVAIDFEHGDLASRRAF
jgi:hypothetical protein